MGNSLLTRRILPQNRAQGTQPSASTSCGERRAKGESSRELTAGRSVPPETVNQRSLTWVFILIKGICFHEINATAQSHHQRHAKPSLTTSSTSTVGNRGKHLLLVGFLLHVLLTGDHSPACHCPQGLKQVENSGGRGKWTQ